MAGILPEQIATPPSTGGDPENPSGPRIYPPDAKPPEDRPTTRADLPAAPQPAAAPAMHTNDVINAALTQAFRPIVPDAVNGLIGPVVQQLMGTPITYYQPRQPAQIKR